MSKLFPILLGLALLVSGCGVKIETPNEAWRNAVRQVALRVTSGEVTFATGSVQIPLGHQRDFAELSRSFNTKEEVLLVEGRASEPGTYLSNEGLSWSRASAVAAAFAACGIPRDRIHIVGLGENAPLFPNDTAEGRLSDQRVRYRIAADDWKATDGFRLK